jgi:hypothetical protein
VAPQTKEPLATDLSLSPPLTLTLTLPRAPTLSLRAGARAGAMSRDVTSHGDADQDGADLIELVEQ